MRTILLVCLGLFVTSALRAQDPCAAPSTSQKATAAQAYVKQKNFGAAEGPAREALKACPSQPVAAWALGGSLFGQKRYADTVAAMSGVIAAKPDVSYAYMWRGRAYYETKTLDKAVQDFQVFLKLNPTAPEATNIKQILAALQQ